VGFCFFQLQTAIRFEQLAALSAHSFFSTSRSTPPEILQLLDGPQVIKENWRNRATSAPPTSSSNAAENPPSVLPNAIRDTIVRTEAEELEFYPGNRIHDLRRLEPHHMAEFNDAGPITMRGGMGGDFSMNLDNGVAGGSGATKKKPRSSRDAAAIKRRCVSTACIACRRRKSKCDGNTPSCAACSSVYGTGEWIEKLSKSVD
jgi:Fungal Zn(2)-Cys(6) binuclear cluster domain